jgi:hypothetical protein
MVKFKKKELFLEKEILKNQKVSQNLLTSQGSSKIFK